MDRASVNGLLLKCGVTQDNIDAIQTDDRALDKLKRRLEKAIPPGLTADEVGIVMGLGFTIETDNAPVEGGGLDPNTKYPHRLPGTEKNPQDRIELITPIMAKMRNKKRDDGREWLYDAKVDSKLVKGEGIKVPLGGMPGDKTVLEKQTKETAVPKKKAKTPTAKGKSAPAEKSEKSKTTKATGGERKKRTGTGAELFAKLISTGKPIERQEIINKLVAQGGMKPTGATNYIAWAQKPIGQKNKWGLLNVFPFRVTVTKGADGKKMVQLVK